MSPSDPHYSPLLTHVAPLVFDAVVIVVLYVLVRREDRIAARRERGRWRAARDASCRN